MKESEAWWLAGQEFEKAVETGTQPTNGCACSMAYSILLNSGEDINKALTLTHDRGAAHLAVMGILHEHHIDSYLFRLYENLEERALVCYFLALECEDEENVNS